MNIVAKAFEFAERAHDGQFRKYTGEPYFIHPARVCATVAEVTDDPEILAAALLHDVVEDTGTTCDDIEDEFTERVANLVFCLSDVATIKDGNRAARNQVNVRHYACAHPDAKTIKLADILDNVPSIIEHDPQFAKVYVAEKQALLDVLANGDPVLYTQARALIYNYYEDYAIEAKIVYEAKQNGDSFLRSLVEQGYLKHFNTQDLQ